MVGVTTYFCKLSQFHVHAQAISFLSATCGKTHPSRSAMRMQRRSLDALFFFGSILTSIARYNSTDNCIEKRHRYVQNRQTNWWTKCSIPSFQTMESGRVPWSHWYHVLAITDMFKYYPVQHHSRSHRKASPQHPEMHRTDRKSAKFHSMSCSGYHWHAQVLLGTTALAIAWKDTYTHTFFPHQRRGKLCFFAHMPLV